MDRNELRNLLALLYAGETSAAVEKIEAFLVGALSADADEEPSYDDSMDGDHASALASAGFGTDEDYAFHPGYDDSEV